MWSLHRRKSQNRTEKAESDGASSGLKNEDYGRVPQYVIFILVWAMIVVAYVIVLEKAVQKHDYLGPRGSQRRTRSFDVLAFFRTGFASIHIPVIVSVLASTVPYWTTVDPSDGIGTETPLAPSHNTINGVDLNCSVTQLFYLADRTWAGLLGWITTCYNSFLVARPSLSWLHLTLVVAFAYIGFPLLSVAYIIESSQYWVPEQFQAAATIGGSNLAFDQALTSMSDLSRWVGKGEFSAAQDHSNDLIGLSVFNSSQKSNIPSLGLSNHSAWASGNSVLTLGSCNSTSNNEDPNCFNNSSILTMWPTNTTTSGYDSFEGQTLTCGSIKNDSSTGLGAIARVQFAVNGPKAWTSVRTCELSVSYVKPIVNTLIGEYIESTTDWAAASYLQIPQGLSPAQLLQLSIAGPLSLFQNGPPPAAGGIDGVTDGFKWISWISDKGASKLSPTAIKTTQLHNLAGTPPPQKREPRTNFLATTVVPEALSSLITHLGITASQANSTSFIPSNKGGVHYSSNPWDLLQIRLNITGNDVIIDGNSLYKPGYINEDVFLKPLASIISRPEFFSNGSTNGVAFKADLKLVRGKVPSVIAITVLMVPIFWTLLLAIIANRYRRWTASLDAFAMFRLGGDWRARLQHLRLASLAQAKKELRLIPGMVRVDAKEGLVELTHPPKRANNGNVAPVREKHRAKVDSRGVRLHLIRAGVDEEQPIVAT